jgi:hypothetical protein
MKNEEKGEQLAKNFNLERALASLRQPDSLLAGKGMVGGEKVSTMLVQLHHQLLRWQPLPQTAPWQGGQHPSLLPITPSRHSLPYTAALYPAPLRAQLHRLPSQARYSQLALCTRTDGNGDHACSCTWRLQCTCTLHATPCVHTEPCTLDALRSFFLPTTHRGLSLSLHSKGCGPGCSGGGGGQTFCCQPRPLATSTRCQPAPSSGPAAISTRCRL